ncbi:MAG: GNAT family N-acetyltransferase [Acidimicrobiia bacterium]
MHHGHVQTFFTSGPLAVGTIVPTGFRPDQSNRSQSQAKLRRRDLTTHEAFREWIGGPDRRMFLPGKEEPVVGLAATKKIDPATVELAGIIVLQAMSGRGLGTILVEEVVDSAPGEGYRAMTVRTETTSEPARSFYERGGFSLTGVATERVVENTVVWELAGDLG